MGFANVGYLAPLTWANPALTSLERQVLAPMFGGHPVEMGMGGNERTLADRLSADSCYRKMFAAAFPENGGEIAISPEELIYILRVLCTSPRTLP